MEESGAVGAQGRGEPVPFSLLFPKAPATGSDLFLSLPGKPGGLALSPPGCWCSSTERTPGLPCTLVPSYGVAPLSPAGL